MRMDILAAIAATVAAAAPAQAQTGATSMWCVAWTEDAATRVYFYSDFFSAGAPEIPNKELAFKNKVERDDSNGLTVKTSCFAPVEHNQAVATRNAARKAAPGKVLLWRG